MKLLIFLLIIFFASRSAYADNLNNLSWWQKAVIYQIYPKSFQDTSQSGTGDLKGIIKRLDYLKDLGINAVWITPFYTSPMIDNGYDIADYVNIDKSYGDMQDFENLISEANKRDIKIIMDLVFNHTSDQHAWFLESKQNKTNPKADWYIWRDEPTNWRGIFGGSAWTFSPERGQYYLHTFAAQQPDLNWENPAVREALYNAAKFWLDKGAAGFRIDAITYIKKPEEFKDGEPDGSDGMVNVHAMTANTPGILEFLNEFKLKVFNNNNIVTVGEANGVKPDELDSWVGNNGVFSMLFEFSHIILGFGDNETWCYPKKFKLTQLKQALSATQNATKNSWAPVFFENHDQPRSINHFFNFAEFNNEQANQAAKALAVLLMTLRGTPFIYQGEELGLENTAWPDINCYNDISSKGQYDFALKEGFAPEQAIKFVHMFSRDNARTPMQWDASANAGFTDANTTPWLPVHEDYLTQNAELESRDANSVLNFYKQMIKFRREHEELILGDYSELELPEDLNEKLFAFTRTFNNSKLAVIINFSLEEASLPEGLDSCELILNNLNNSSNVLQPLEARIYKLN
ncbi:MAG: alpha-glucosidase [Synergistaceae bacterium]|nr:alpha-glucosidase [Synergistaceae bacterium]